jgi:hypothetical protein
MDLVEIEPVPDPCDAQGIASRGQPAEEPLGRRIPEPLDAARQGVQR